VADVATNNLRNNCDEKPSFFKKLGFFLRSQVGWANVFLFAHHFVLTTANDNSKDFGIEMVGNKNTLPTLPGYLAG
jgi:hypothetical protein